MRREATCDTLLPIFLEADTMGASSSWLLFLLGSCLSSAGSMSMLALMSRSASATSLLVGLFSTSFLIFCIFFSCVLDWKCSYLMQFLSSSLLTSN